MKDPLTYILITAARNEEEFIENTILSVVSQTIPPLKWVIVSDGSTDGTDEIVRKYARRHDWIEFLRMPEHADRQFAAKVRCFNAGYQKTAALDFDIVGNLDADMTFESDYLEYLLGQFKTYPELGVAGTPFTQGPSSSYDYRFTNIEHVSGACQLFRRLCFESIGGYQPIEGGGIDWVAVTTARMKGWMTRTFVGKTAFHHRKMGTEKSGEIGAGYRLGKKDYFLGNHLLWEIFRVAYQVRYRPYVLGGLAILVGYCSAAAMRMKRPVPRELVNFSRQEQMKRLLAKVTFRKWRG